MTDQPKNAASLPDRTQATIEAVDYEPVNGLMLVSTNGRLDMYFRIPLEVYLGFKFAARPAEYFLARIAGRFAVSFGG